MSEETAAQDVADELYAGPPAEFVARRDELARQARAAGDRTLAAALKALRRPSVGAWYLNTAARAELGSLREVLAFGEQLRAAQSSGDFGTIRDLAPRRGQLVNDAVREMTALLTQHGTTPTAAGLDEVRATLASALADPDVAAQVGSGRLDRPHTYGGFGELSPIPAPPSRPADTTADVAPAGDAGDARRTAAALAERERRAEEARRELHDAEANLEQVRSRKADLEDEVRAARSRVEELLAALEAVRHEATVAEAELAHVASEEESALGRVEAARVAAGS